MSELFYAMFLMVHSIPILAYIWIVVREHSAFIQVIQTLLVFDVVPCLWRQIGHTKLRLRVAYHLHHKQRSRISNVADLPADGWKCRDLSYGKYCKVTERFLGAWCTLTAYLMVRTKQNKYVPSRVRIYCEYKRKSTIGIRSVKIVSTTKAFYKLHLQPWHTTVHNSILTPYKNQAYRGFDNILSININWSALTPLRNSLLVWQTSTSMVTY